MPSLTPQNVGQKRYYQVQDEYNQFLANNPDLKGKVSMGDYARGSDQADAEKAVAAGLSYNPTRSAGYAGDSWWKNLIGSEERLVDPISRYTAPAVGWVGKQADSVFGTDGRLEAVGHEIGQTLPIDIAEQIAFSASDLMTGGGSVPVHALSTAAKLSKYGNFAKKALGFGAMINTGARQAAQTDSLAQGGIAAAMLPVGDWLVGRGALKGMGVADNLTGSKVGNLESLRVIGNPEATAANVMREAVKGGRRTVAGAAVGGGLGGLGANELQHQLAATVEDIESNARGEFDAASSWERHDPLSVENIAGNLIGTTLGAQLPRLAKTINSKVELNPKFMERYTKHLSNLRDLDTQYSNMVASGVSHGDAFKSAVDSASGIADLTAKNEQIAKNAQVLSAKLSGSSPMSRDQGVIEYMKSAPIESLEDFESRIGASRAIYAKLYKYINDVNRGKILTESRANDDISTPDLPSGKAVVDLHEKGYLDLSDAKITEMLTTAQKEALSDEAPAATQQKVLRTILDKITVDFREAHARYARDMVNADTTNLSWKDQLLAEQGGIAGADLKSQRKMASANTDFDGVMRKSMQDALTSLDEVKAVGFQLNDASGQPARNIFDGYALDNRGVTGPDTDNPSYSSTEERKTRPAKFTLDSLFSEAVNHITHFDQGMDVRGKVAQFAEDFHRIWNGVKDEAQKTGVIPWNKKVDLPAGSVWMKNAEDRGTVSMSFADLFRTTGKPGEANNFHTNPNRAFKTDPNISRRQWGHFDGEERIARGEGAEAEMDDLRGSEFYTPGEYNDGYESLKRSLWNESLGEDFDSLDVDEQEARVTQAKAVVSNIDRVKSKFNLSEFDAPEGKLQSAHNEELWKKYAGLLLRPEEGGTLKPRGPRKDMFISNGHLLLRAMLDLGPTAAGGKNSVEARGQQNLPQSVLTYMDAVEPGWRSKANDKMSLLSLVRKRMDSVFSKTFEGSYNEAYEKLVRLHTGVDKPAELREAAKTNAQKTAEKRAVTETKNLDDDISKFLADSQRLTVGKILDEPVTAVYQQSQTGYDSPNRVYALVAKHGLDLGVGEDMAHLFATAATKAISNLGKEAKGLTVYDYKIDNSMYDVMSPAQKIAVIGKLVHDTELKGVYDSQTKSLGVTSAVNPVPNSMSKLHDMQSIVGTVIHELIHYTEKQALGLADYDMTNQYAAERVLSMQKAMDAVQAITPSDRRQLLEHMAQFMMPYLSDENTPEHVRMETKLALDYGVSKPNEFLTTLAQLTGQGFLNDQSKYKVPVENLYSFMPNEVALYLKGIVRDAQYNLDALNQSNPVKGVDLTPIVENLRKVVQGENVRLSEAAFSNVIKQLSDGTGLDKFVPSMAVYNNPHLPDIGHLSTEFEEIHGARRKGPAIVHSVVQMLNGKSKTDPVNLNFWQKNFVPFMQVMSAAKNQGLDAAADVSRSFANFAPHRNNIMTRLYSAVLEKDPSNNSLRMARGADGELAGFIKIQQKPMGAKAVNAVHNFEQVNNTVGKPGSPATVMVEIVQTQTGPRFQLNPQHQAEFDRITAGLTPNEKGNVIEAVGKNKLMAQEAGRVLVETHLSNTAHSLAQKALMFMQHHASNQLPPMGWRDVLSATNTMVQAAFRNDQQRYDAAKNQFAAWPEMQARMEEIIHGKNPNDPNSRSLIETYRNMRSTMLRDSAWYAPQQRHGRYLVMSKDITGQLYVDGAENYTLAKRTQAELDKKGYLDVRIVDKFSNDARGKMQSYDSLLDKMMDLADEGYDMFLQQNPAGLSAADISKLETFSPADYMHNELKKKSIHKYFLERKGIPSALGHDYIKYMHHYLTSVSESAARKELVNFNKTVLADYTMSNQDEFRNVVNGHLEGVLAPNPEGWRTVKALTSAYYLALNLSSMVVEGAQTLQTLVPQLIKAWDGNKQKGSSMVGSYKTYMAALGEASRFSKIGKVISDPKLAEKERGARLKMRSGQPLTPEEERILLFQRAHHEGELTHSAISEDSFANDQRAVINNAFSQAGEDRGVGQFLTDKGYWAADHAMKVYRLASGFNNKVALLAGLMDGQKKGLKGDELYYHARNIKHLAMFDGGKMNQPMYINNWSNPRTRAAVSAYHTLQQYSMAMLGHYLQMGQESLPEQVGGVKVPAGVRIQARKALATTLITQMGLAGTLGLPLAGAAMTLAEDIGGVDAEQAMREFFAKLGQYTPFEEDFADIGMSGFLNFKTGIDFGSRMSSGSFAGLSYYNGFSVKDLAGPIAGVVEQMYRAKGFAQQGDMMRATHALLPNGLKGAAERGMTYARFGDSGVRDQSNRLMAEPDAVENASMYLGFKPSEVNIKSNLNRRLQDKRTSAKTREDANLDQLAMAYRQGNIGPAREYATQVLQETRDPQSYFSTLKSISDRAAQMEVMRDFTQGQTRVSAPDEQRLFATYRPDMVQGSSNIEQAIAQTKNAARGGLPTSGNNMTKAVLLDTLMQRGLSRVQAEQMIGMM